MLLWSGIGLILAGLAVLGYIGWQLYGTTWVAKREQERIVRETERQWESGGDGSATGLSRDVVALIRIPAFGNDYVVPAHVGTDSGTLARGFGIFESAADPGDRGNFSISG